MILFLLKGIINDRSRSLLPIIVVSIGVMITVLLHCWINGIMGEAITMNANFNNGHLKITTRAYAQNADQMPNDLAIIGADTLMISLKKHYPQIDWVERIRFGALIDFPDKNGETRSQGTIIGWSIDLLSNNTNEKARFNLQKAIVRGRIPNHASEALISENMAKKLHVSIGNHFTLFGTTMDGSMALKNFIVAGTIHFGAAMIDRGAIIIDIRDAQSAFQMTNATGEILGFSNEPTYNDKTAAQIAASFNALYTHSTDEFAPQMMTLKQQEGMFELIQTTNTLAGIFIFIFVMAMSVVLWNTGLIGSLRRYNEFGVRLALGESKSHIYKTLLGEGLLIGFIGTIIGTSIGLTIAFIIKEKGIDISGMMQNSTIMIPSTIRTIITPSAWIIGFIPGIMSIILGNALAGIAIYKRQTAQLFKELEN